MNWRDFISAWKEVPSYLYDASITLWATPLWWKITTIIYLVTLFGGMWFSITAMIAWMDSLSANVAYEYNPLDELIFWGWMFGTIAGMFVYREIFSRVASKVLLFLNCIEEGDLD